MKPRSGIALVLALLTFIAAAPLHARAPKAALKAAIAPVVPVPHIPPVLVDQFEFHDTVQPQRARIFAAAVAAANSDGAAALIVNLGTPGGMPASADEMVAAMRQSRVPIIIWLGNSPSRISGEGLRLLAEADLALMSNHSYLTPLWTETPRRLSAERRSFDSKRLALNLRSSVAAHGRNAAIIDELSSGVHWFSAQEAINAGFIDGIADKQSDVLRFATDHGYRRAGVLYPLNIVKSHIEVNSVGPQDQLLVSLMNPDLCVLLLTLGLLLIYLEINTPGTIVPGAAGLLIALLAVYSLSRLQLTGIGLTLCVVAVVFLVAEARFPRHGILAFTGILCLCVGLGLLVNGPLPQLQVGWIVAIGAGIGFGGVTASLVVLGAEARRSKIRTGSEAMLGWLAIAQTPLSPEGQILVRGELWKARLTSSDGSVAAGDHVKVLKADGLILEVTAVPITQSA